MYAVLKIIFLLFKYYLHLRKKYQLTIELWKVDFWVTGSIHKHRAKLIDDQARTKKERKKRNQICMMIMRS